MLRKVERILPSLSMRSNKALPTLEHFGSVLDVEMTILDKQSKGIPIDEQPNDDVVHLY